METIRKQFERELKNLEIEEDAIITIKLVEKKFRRKALKVHSDKTGNKDDDKDEEFKQLVGDYNKLVNALEKFNAESNIEVEEKTDLSTFFEKHNFAKECTQSWTIFVEKLRVQDWKKEMTKRYPESRNLQGNGIQYKTILEGGTVSTTLYDVLIPKMNIQGNQRSIRKFVIDVLPEIYRDICENSSAEKIHRLPLNAKMKLSGETVYSCEVCDKKYIRKTAMKKHIQIKHAPPSIQSRANNDQSNRPAIISLPMFNVADPSTSTQKVSIEENIKNNVVEDNVEGTSDDLPCTLQEIVDAEVIEEPSPLGIDENWQCGECGIVADTERNMTAHINQAHEPEPKEDENRVSEREFSILKRRHDQLKEKYDEVIKKNREYSQNLFETMKENSELKDAAEKDAEALMDALGINQVLVEEIKIKDKIIETNEMIKKTANTDEVEVIVDNSGAISKFNCSECTWTTTNQMQMAGHMIKHTIGQYQCETCKQTFKTKSDHNKHKAVAHENKQSERPLTCITCNKLFETEHSLKQHIQSKHKGEVVLPVGHPQRYARAALHPSQNIACTKCDKRFSTGRQIEEHMTEHDDESNIKQEYKNPRDTKICRYFRKGNCLKGNRCLFKHTSLPVCNRGQECIFLAQNRCRFSHPEFINNKRDFANKKDCKYKSECWNQITCAFRHPQQGFQFVQKTNRPPQVIPNMSVWMDY